MTSRDRWRLFVETLPGIREIRNPTEEVLRRDDHVAYESLLRRLPSHTAEAFREDSAEPDTSTPPASRVATWCLADMPEGDFPRIHAFASLSELLKAIAVREGTDTAVWPFYGFPFRLTKHVVDADGVSRRYLQLDTSTAVLVTSGPAIESVSMETLSGDVEFEDEGWLGDPALRRKTYFVDGFVEENEASRGGGTQQESEG